LIDSHHKYFTYHEQQIIEKYVAENNLIVVLPIHDGFITAAKPKTLETSYMGHNFRFSCDKFELIAETNENANRDTHTISSIEYTNEETEYAQINPDNTGVDNLNELMEMFNDWEKQYGIR
jgi:hypothetical protein